MAAADPSPRASLALDTHQSLARRLLLYLIPIATLGICVLGVSAYLIARRYALENVDKEIKTLGEQAGNTLSGFFRQRANDLATICESPLLADYYNNRDFGLLQEAETYRREIERYLLRFSLRDAGIYNRLAYVNSQGTEVCKIEGTSIVGRLGTFPRPDALAAARALPPSRHYESVVTADPQYGPTVLYCKPLYSQAGEFKGAVILECSLEPARQILERLHIGPSGWAYLTDSSDRFVLGKAPPASALRDSLLSSAAPVAGTQWKVAVGARMSDFLKPLGQIKNLTILLGILCTLLVALFITLGVRSLTRPIELLVQATKRLEIGDLSGRVSVAAPDEIGILSKSFNTMAESLEERTRDLEARVRQLTALREMEGSVIQRQDEETILKSCLKAVAKGLSFDRTALYWVNLPEREIVGRYLYGTDAIDFSEETLSKRRLSMDGADILCEVVRRRSAALVKDVRRDPRLNALFVQESKTREFVLAPICGKDKVFGVIAADNLYGGRALGESDKEGLMLFANAVGLALENMTLLQHLTESEARYRTVLESSPVAVIGLSKEHRITTWNRGAERIFGYQQKEIVGKPLTALFPKDCDAEYKSLIAEVMHRGSVRDYSLRGLMRSGARLELSLSWGGAYPDFWMNNEWAVVIRDTTEAKKLQQQIIRSEKLSAVGQLISSIAHELNNPLQAVVGYSQLLANECGLSVLPAKKPAAKKSRKKAAPAAAIGVQEDLRMIIENALRCRKIIDNLLLFVRHGEVEKRPMQVENAIQSSLDLLEYKLRKVDNIRVELHLPPGLPPVKADSQQLQQVFVNLINNACDAMKDWHGSKLLRIQAKHAQEVIVLEVADSGPGIPEQVRDRLFEPFFTTKPEGRGTGLGLSVCRQIVEEHGGRIGFDSQPGQGTSFWLELPVAKGAEERPAERGPAIPAVRGKSILVIDDEPDVLSFLTKVITAGGNHAETASSLEESAAKAGRRAFDLVVADVHLGEGTGIALYENWPQWSRYPKPAFIFLTGDVLDAALGHKIEDRGLVLLHKPVDLEDFQRVVHLTLAQPNRQA